MRAQDLQKVGLMVSIIVLLIASKLPFAAFCLAMFLWPGILAFDGLENRNPMRRLE